MLNMARAIKLQFTLRSLAWGMAGGACAGEATPLQENHLLICSLFLATTELFCRKHELFFFKIKYVYF